MNLEVLEDRCAAYNLVGGWSSQEITYSFVGNVSSSLQILTENALGAWAKFAPLHFKEQLDLGFVGNYTQGYDGSGLPQIRFHFHQELPPNILGYAYFPGSDSYGLSGDVFISDAAFTNFPAQVILHEVGHALGLGHSDVKGSVMLPMVNGTVLLGDDDIAGIQAIYGTGSGDVVPLNPEKVVERKGTPPGEDPFPGYLGKRANGEVNLNNDGFTDYIFMAASQGHVKIYDGLTGRNVYSHFAFPGFNGDVNLLVNLKTATVVAQNAQGHAITYGNGFNETSSIVLFPGYNGDVSLNNDGDKVEVTAKVGNYMHTKVLIQGVEVDSFIH